MGPAVVSSRLQHLENVFTNPLPSHGGGRGRGMGGAGGVTPLPNAGPSHPGAPRETEDGGW